MEGKQEFFTSKLFELERQYGQMISRLKLSQQDTQEDIQKKYRQVLQEFKEHNFRLQTEISSGRSPAVSALARLQLNCFRSCENLLAQELPAYLHNDAGSQQEDEAEAFALYAEYAMDFAVQSMRYALMAALQAMDMQMSCTNEKKEETADE